MNRYPILNTKLYKPDLKDNYVFRNKIIEILEKDVGTQLTLVVAPTGYGKSITISEWLNYNKTKHCWISLDEELDDLRTFLAYLSIAVRTVLPDAIEELYELTNASELPPEKVLSNLLINALDDLDEDLIIVLDDYHKIKNQQIHSLVNEVLKYIPRGLHLVIISRRDPPLNLSYLKSFDKVNEIRMSELNFNKNELIELANDKLGIRLNDQTAEKLLERTEGWIVGLRLALLSFDRLSSIEEALTELKGDKHYFTKYLLSEVFNNLEPDVKEIVLVASILERFNRELVKTILEDKHKSKNDYTIDDLFIKFQNSSLFIIPLDYEAEWFRFHHFFREFLLRRLEKEYSREQIIKFHKKASLYFEERSLFEEAFHHLLKADDINGTISIINRNIDDLFLKEQLNRLRHWLSLLPAGTTERNPELLIARAISNISYSNYDLMLKDLKMAEDQMAPLDKRSIQSRKLWCDYYSTLSASLFYAGKPKDALDYANRAIKLNPSHESFAFYYGFMLRGLCLNVLNRTNDATDNFNQFISSIPNSNRLGLMRGYQYLALHYYYQGDLASIKSSATLSAEIALDQKIPDFHAMGNTLIMWANYLQNDLNQVDISAQSLNYNRFSARLFFIAHAYIAHIFSLLARGKLEPVNEEMNELKNFAVHFNYGPLDNTIKTVEIEIAIRKNDKSRAREIASSTDFKSYPLNFTFFIPQLTEIKYLLMEDEENNLLEAKNLLNKYFRYTKSNYNVVLLIQLYALNALWYKKTGEVKKAQEDLMQSLQLGKPGNFIRIFVDRGNEMKELIQQLNEEEKEDVFIQKILNVFEKEQKIIDSNKIMEKTLEKNLDLNQPINKKEIELIRLVAEGYRNKEIAGKLNLSPESIKKYLSTIYQKLEVNNRASAVAKANELKLI